MAQENFNPLRNSKNTDSSLIQPTLLNSLDLFSSIDSFPVLPDFPQLPQVPKHRLKSLENTKSEINVKVKRNASNQSKSGKVMRKVSGGLSNRKRSIGNRGTLSNQSSPSRQIKKDTKSICIESLFDCGDIGICLMECNCLWNTVTGNFSGKIFITPGYFCFSTLNVLEIKSKFLISGDSIIYFKISKEKARLQFSVLMKNSEKRYIFKKLDLEFLSFLPSWFKSFKCIDISKKKNIIENNKENLHLLTQKKEYSSSNSVKETETSDTIRQSEDYHIESSDESIPKPKTQQAKKPILPDANDSGTLKYVNDEVESFLANLEASTDALYK